MGFWAYEKNLGGQKGGTTSLPVPYSQAHDGVVLVISRGPHSSRVCELPPIATGFCVSAVGGTILFARRPPVVASD